MVPMSVILGESETCVTDWVDGLLVVMTVKCAYLTFSNREDQIWREVILGEL